MTEDTTEIDGTNVTGLTQIDRLMSTMVAVMVIISIFSRLMWTLWITSPSGKTTRKMPFYTALRIIRKQGWHMTSVEPTRPKRTISRWQALSILLLGDNQIWQR